MQFCRRGDGSTVTSVNPASASIASAVSRPHIAPSPGPPATREVGTQNSRLFA